MMRPRIHTAVGIALYLALEKHKGRNDRDRGHQGHQRGQVVGKLDIFRWAALTKYQTKWMGEWLWVLKVPSVGYERKRAFIREDVLYRLRLPSRDLRRALVGSAGDRGS